jgi:hypothetical protein
LRLEVYTIVAVKGESYQGKPLEVLAGRVEKDQNFTYLTYEALSACFVDDKIPMSTYAGANNTSPP